MAREIRFTGLDERSRRQLSQTVKFISNSYNKARLVEWDGLSGDVLVTDARSVYGRRAIAQAERIGIAVVEVTDEPDAMPHPTVKPTGTTAHLTRAVKAALPTSSGQDGEHEAAILRLANTPSLRGRNLDAVRDSARINIRPATGCVFAASYHDLRVLTAELLKPNWVFEPAGHRKDTTPHHVASMSLVAFYLRAANSGIDMLPAPPAERVHLVARPNLGEAADLEYPVRALDVLSQQAGNAVEVAEYAGLDHREVTITYWALRAAGLVVLDSERTPAATHGARVGRWLERFWSGPKQPHG